MTHQNGQSGRSFEDARISIYVQKNHWPDKPFERLREIGEKVDRPLNYMIIEAVLDYVNRHENNS